MDSIFCVKGANGYLELYEDRVRIGHYRNITNRLNMGAVGDKDVYLRNITGIQFKEPGTFTVGYIQFMFSGGSESKGGVFDAVKDENTVTFTRPQIKQFRDFKERAEMMMNNSRGSSMDELVKLAELRDKGVVSEEEFAAKKKRLLGL